MGRPQTRLYRVDQETMDLIVGVFGKPLVAFQRLRLEGLVSFHTFRRVWKGLPVNESVVGAIYRGWESFANRIVEVQRRRAG